MNLSVSASDMPVHVPLSNTDLSVGWEGGAGGDSESNDTRCCVKSRKQSQVGLTSMT